MCVCVCVLLLSLKQNLKGEASALCQGHVAFLMSSPLSEEEEGKSGL